MLRFAGLRRLLVGTLIVALTATSSLPAQAAQGNGLPVTSAPALAAAAAPQSLTPPDFRYSYVQSPTRALQFGLGGLAPRGATVEVFVRRDGAEPQPVGSAEVPSQSWSLRVDLTALWPDPPHDGSYAFTAVATLNGESSPEAEPFVVVVDQTPPPPPEGLMATAVDESHVVLRWEPSPDPGTAAYWVYEGDVGRLRTAETAAALGRLEPETSYTFTLQAEDEAGNRSDPSAPVTVSTPPVANALVTQRVSESQEGTSGDDDSEEPSLSADGRLVAFTSWASSLVPDDTNGVSDIFVRDLQEGTIERVSLSDSGAEAEGYSENPDISADGRYVAFKSHAPNLVDGVTDTNTHIYVRDRLTGTTELIDVLRDADLSDYSSSNPRISGDGRYVAFLSSSGSLAADRRVAFLPGAGGYLDSLPDGHNLVAAGAASFSGYEELFVRDRVQGTTERISLGYDGSFLNGSVEYPGISADGRYVVFVSWADNVVPGDTNGAGDIFVYDRETGLAERVSVSSSGVEADSGSSEPAISPDGRYVVFRSNATNLVDGETQTTGGIYLHDRYTGATRRLSYECEGVPVLDHEQLYNPAVSRDGRYVAVWHEDEENIYLVNTESGEWTRYSRSVTGGQPNGGFDAPVISADGSAVAFASSARNLVLQDWNSRDDVFVVRAGDAAPPVWPADAILTAAAVGGTFVTLHWPAATDDVAVTGYDLYQDGVLVAQVAGHLLTYTVTGLMPETAYTFQVAARDAAGHTTAGPALTVTTTAGAGLTVSVEPGGIAELTWDPAGAPDLAGYRIWRAVGAEAAVPVAQVDAATTTYRDTGLAAATAYTYHVTLLKEGGGESPYTEAVTVTTPDLTAPELDWGAGRNGRVAPLGTDLRIRLLGEPHRRAEATVTYQDWFAADGSTRLPEPRTATAVVALTEDTAAPGIYRGTFTLREGVVAVTGLTGQIDDGAGHTAAAPPAAGFPLAVSGALAVAIVAPDTDILAGSTLSVYNRSLGSGGRTAVAGPGTYQVTGLTPAADYTFELRGPAHERLALGTVSVVEAGLTTPVTVTPDLPAHVQMQVTAPDGTPLAGVQVAVFNLDQEQALGVRRTDADGRTEPVVGSLAGQQVLVQVSGLPLPYAARVGQRFSLSPGSNQLTIAVPELRQGTVTGQVTYQGEPVAGVRVTAVQELDGRSHTTWVVTDAEGDYSLTTYSGEAAVSAASSPEPVYLTRWPVPVEVPAGGTVNQDLALDTIGWGDLDVTIQYRKLDGSTGTVGQVNTLGLFFPVRVTTSVGVYDYRPDPPRFRARGGETVEVCVNGRPTDLPSACQEVTLDDLRHADVTFTLEQVAAVSGQLLDPGGAPLRGAWYANLYRVTDPDSGARTFVRQARGSGSRLSAPGYLPRDSTRWKWCRPCGRGVCGWPTPSPPPCRWGPPWTWGRFNSSTWGASRGSPITA